jgi:hypothetical protein
MYQTTQCHVSEGRSFKAAWFSSKNEIRPRIVQVRLLYPYGVALVTPHRRDSVWFVDVHISNFSFWIRSLYQRAAFHLKQVTSCTYFMEQSPSWQANRFSSSQEIPRILRNPKVYYRINKCPPHVPKTHFPKFHLNIILPSTPGSFPRFIFLSNPYQNPLYTSPLPPYVLHVLPITTVIHKTYMKRWRYVHSNAHKVIAGFFSKSRFGGDVEVQLPS